MVDYPVLPTGTNQYIFESRIGDASGAFGELWKVRSKQGGPREYACKKVRVQPGVTLDDIKNEIKAIRRLCTTDNPAIVQVFSHWLETDNSGTACFIVMELMDTNYGTYLDEWCETLDFWQDWFHEITTDVNIIDILSGLEFIHSLDQVHRDLKPANVLIKFLGPSHWRLKIADFGFTAVAESGRMNFSVQGRMTPIYCAPELLINNSFSKKSDIWAFGCILAFSSLTAITSYYYTANAPAPQINWKTLQLSPHAIPIAHRPYREVVERQWDHLNRIFKSIFDRNPEARPTAAMLIQDLTQYNEAHHENETTPGH